MFILGKVYHWFKFAAKHFPSAALVGKMDLDTIANWTGVLYDLERFDRLDNLYYGNMIDYKRCGEKHYCPKLFSFHRGPLYLVGSGLVRWIDQNIPPTDEHIVGVEDILIADWLHNGDVAVNYQQHSDYMPWRHCCKDLAKQKTFQAKWLRGC